MPRVCSAYCVGLAILGIGAAGTAAAHPTLLFTEPAADTAVPYAPQAITLMFNEQVSIGSDAIVVLDRDRPRRFRWVPPQRRVAVRW